ncbi:MAG: hypothetical protein JJ992_27630, partial [Planctomycetes bacterium]|nr:hypothetical protein [Planctomycetota bacterium]
MSSQSFVLNTQAAGLKSDTRENSVSLAFTVGYVENNARAYIDDGAEVIAAGNLEVRSSTHLPWEQKWTAAFGQDKAAFGQVLGVAGKLNINFGIKDGFFTSWAEATAAGQKFAFGMQGNFLVVDNSSEAWIGAGARVTVGGNAAVLSTTENDSVNFAGQFLYFTGPPDSILTGSETTQQDAKGIGGSILTVSYDNDTTADIRSGAIVDAGSLLVMARSDSRNISIATQGGKSDGLSVSGAASALLIDDNTVARIDDGAFVTTRNGLVSIPRDFDEFDTGQNSLFTTIATFTPQETTDIDTTTQRVDVDTDTIDLPYAHGLETGDAVRYFNGGGENIGGLTSNQFYYVIKVDDTALQLAATPTGSAIDLDLDATSGT